VESAPHNAKLDRVRVHCGGQYEHACVFFINWKNEQSLDSTEFADLASSAKRP